MFAREPKLIDQDQHQRVECGATGPASGDAHRRPHSLGPLGIRQTDDGETGDGGAHRGGVRAQHHRHGLTTGLQGHFRHAPDELLALQADQLLRLPEPSRGAGRQDRGSNRGCPHSPPPAAAYGAGNSSAGTA